MDQYMSELLKIVRKGPGATTLDQVRKMLYESPTNTADCTVCGQTLHVSGLAGVADDQGAYIWGKCMHEAYLAECAANVS